MALYCIAPYIITIAYVSYIMCYFFQIKRFSNIQWNPIKSNLLYNSSIFRRHRMDIRICPVLCLVCQSVGSIAARRQNRSIFCQDSVTPLYFSISDCKF